MIPSVSTIGWMLPGLFAGELLTSFVLGIPTLSPIFLWVAAEPGHSWPAASSSSLALLTVIGTLISTSCWRLSTPESRSLSRWKSKAPRWSTTSILPQPRKRQRRRSSWPVVEADLVAVPQAQAGGDLSGGTELPVHTGGVC